MENPIIIGLTNALTDVLIEVSEIELSDAGLNKGNANSRRNLNHEKFDALIHKPSKKYLGGAPTNTIRSLNNLGYKCGLIGSVGNDELGADYLETLLVEDIDMFFMTHKNQESGICYVFITPDKERSFIHNEGIFAGFGYFPLQEIPNIPLFYTSGYELISNPEITLQYFESAQHTDAKIAFDLGVSSRISRYHKEFIKAVRASDILFTTTEEAAAYGGLERLLDPQKIVILKKGKEGSQIYHHNIVLDIPPARVDEIINTNGAGDSYAAGFLSAYLKGQDLQSCGEFASKIAAKVCSQEESWYKGDK